MYHLYLDVNKCINEFSISNNLPQGDPSWLKDHQPEYNERMTDEEFEEKWGKCHEECEEYFFWTLESIRIAKILAFHDCDFDTDHLNNPYINTDTMPYEPENMPYTEEFNCNWNEMLKKVYLG